MSKLEAVRRLMAKCVHCPGEAPIHVANLPMPLGDLAELLGAVHCPNCGAGPDAIRVAQDTNEIEVVE